MTYTLPTPTGPRYSRHVLHASDGRPSYGSGFIDESDAGDLRREYRRLREAGADRGAAHLALFVGFHVGYRARMRETR